MRQITKLAIIEHGEAAVRVATAAAAPQLDDAPALATVMFATGAGPAPWFAREADDIVPVPLAGGEAVPSESRLPADAHIDPPPSSRHCNAPAPTRCGWGRCPPRRGSASCAAASEPE